MRLHRPFMLGLGLLAPATVRAQSSAPASPPVRFSGYLQARETWQQDVGLTASINRARLTASGAIVDGVTWRIQGEFRTGNVGTGRASVSLQDAFIRYAKDTWGVQAGQFKTPFTSQYVMSLTLVETADRAAVVDSLAPKRQIGFMGEYTFAKRVSVYGGVFNRNGQNVTTNSDSSSLGVGRLVVRVLPQLSIGTYGARYFGDSTRYGFEANVETPRFVARGEWLAQSRDGFGGPDDKGWYALAGYFVAPGVQVVGEYEEFRRDAISLQQKNRAWTAVLNLYPWSRNTRIVLEYVSRKIGDPGVRKGQVLGQFQVVF
ncbi:MAG TPA: porin [Gemmatimonadales bacterium]|nr:porin [Gemmatimonadales bacterium]